jgi:hypothetical protein
MERSGENNGDISRKGMEEYKMEEGKQREEHEN